MSDVIAIIKSEELVELGALMVDLPQNADGLKVLITRFEGKVRAWINSCPHDGRPPVVTQHFCGKNGKSYFSV